MTANSNALPVSLTVLPHAEGLPLPTYATPQSAGMDLMAAIDAPMTLAPGQRALVPTGISIALPPGHEAQVRPPIRTRGKIRHYCPQHTRHDRRRL